MAETATRLAVLEGVARRLERRWGGGTLQRLGGRPAGDAAVIPTGFPALDLALGVGGLTRGRIVELYGHRSSGKVTLAAHILAQALRRGGLAAYVDVPHLLDPSYLSAHGVDLEYLLIAQPESAEEALAIVDVLARSGGLDLVVFDSMADLFPTGDRATLARARLLSASLRRLAGAIAGSPTVFLFINRAAPLAGDAALFGEAHDIPDDKKVLGQIGLVDHVQLVGQLVGYGGSDRPVLGMGPGLAQLIEIDEGRIALRHGEDGEAIVGEAQVHRTALGDGDGVGDGAGVAGEELGHLRRRLEIVLAVGPAQASRGVEDRAVLDAD